MICDSLFYKYTAKPPPPRANTGVVCAFSVRLCRYVIHRWQNAVICDKREGGEPYDRNVCPCSTRTATTSKQQRVNHFSTTIDSNSRKNTNITITSIVLNGIVPMPRIQKPIPRYALAHQYTTITMHTYVFLARLSTDHQ